MVGIDISMGMLRQARQRCAGSTGVALMRGSGRDLAAFADEGFDLVCAVDSFPYLVDAGVAARHIEDAARLLKPGGALLIVNYSYRADRSADRKELLRLVVSTGLEPVCDSAVQFRHWDGVVFQFLKRSK
jgi:ubiquinone/menaquinone biosynthesis C-methylase UbiE